MTLDIADVYREVVAAYAADGPLPPITPPPAGTEHAVTYEVPAIILRKWVELAGDGPSDFHTLARAVEESDLPGDLNERVIDAAMDSFTVTPDVLNMVLAGGEVPTLREALAVLRRAPIRDLQAPALMAILNAVAALTGDDDFAGELPRPVGVIDESLIPAQD